MKRIVSNLLAILTLLTLLTGCEGSPDEPVIGGDIVDVGEYRNLSVSEVMADNDRFVLGCMDDWIELYNDNENDLRLTSCYLRKRDKSSKRLTLDDRTIPAKGYLVIKLTEESPFRLNKEGDSVVLVSGSGVVDELTYDASIGECSFTHSGLCEHPTPGFPNTEAGYIEYLDSRPLPPLMINEVISSNSKFLPVEENYYDLVEVTNTTNSPINLGDYYLSDKKSEPMRYHFPFVSLEPGGFFVVCCSGLAAGDDHASFKISSTGETVYLSKATGFVDALHVPGDLPKNESFGRNGTRLVYMFAATPGGENAKGAVSTLEPPTANLPSGQYAEPISVELSGEGEVHYTLDGSVPDSSSPVYSEPVGVDGVVTFRAVCVSEGRVSAETSFTYLVGADHVYPVINIAIKQEYLDGEEGVLNHIEKEYEHEAFVTLTSRGEEGFAVPCGFKLHGNDSKKGEKQNFQLRFRSAYGMSKLEYKVFGSREQTEYNSLILKGGSEDYPFCGLRDELCTSLVDGVTNLSVQAYRPVILYLNGQYWGFYWLRERFDSTMFGHELGVSADSVNIMKTYGMVCTAGDGSGFTELIGYCKTHDLKDPECYNFVMSRVDAFSLMDWYICRSYFADQDLANVRMFNSDEGDGKWRWCFYDLDWSFFVNAEDSLSRTMPDDGNHAIILALLKNPEFRDIFLKRYAYLMQVVLNERAIIARIDELAAIMEPEIAMDRARYGYTVEAWHMNLETLKNFVRGGNRDKAVLKSIQNYFRLTDSEMTLYFGV